MSLGNSVGLAASTIFKMFATLDKTSFNVYRRQRAFLVFVVVTDVAHLIAATVCVCVWVWAQQGRSQFVFNQAFLSLPGGDENRKTTTTTLYDKRQDKFDRG